MYKYFKFNQKDINDFFKEEDIYKYCKKCNTKTLKDTKFCMECGSKEFYKDYKSYLLATTKYCTVCLSKVKGDRCSCGSTDFTSASKAFDKINSQFLSKVSSNVDMDKQELNKYESKIKEKEAELKTTIKKVDNLLQTYNDYLKELELIEKNKLKELKKYQIVDENSGEKKDIITVTTVQGAKIILETKQELLMDSITKLDQLSKQEEAYKNIEDVYSARFTNLNLKDNFREEVISLNDEYLLGEEKANYASNKNEVVKRFTRAAEVKHPGAIQGLANYEFYDNRDFKQYLIKHLQALDLLSIALQNTTRKHNGIFEDIVTKFVGNFAIQSLTCEESYSSYFEEVKKQYENAAKQYSNSPSQNSKKGR